MTTPNVRKSKGASQRFGTAGVCAEEEQRFAQPLRMPGNKVSETSRVQTLARGSEWSLRYASIEVRNREAPITNDGNT